MHVYLHGQCPFLGQVYCNPGWLDLDAAHGAARLDLEPVAGALAVEAMCARKHDQRLARLKVGHADHARGVRRTPSGVELAREHVDCRLWQAT